MSIDDYIRGKISALLKTTDIPITVISQLIGYNSAYLTQIVQGSKMPSFEGLQAICDYFQITISDFFQPDFQGISDSYLQIKLNDEDKKFLLEIIKDEEKLKAIEQLVRSFDK